MMDVQIPLTKKMSQEQIEQIVLFRERFQELWANWESLKNLGIELGGNFTNIGGNMVSGPGCGVEIHRLKGYYLDFRVFYADNELTNFNTIKNLLGQHCDDEIFRGYLKKSKKEWLAEDSLYEWHGVNADEMIDVLFNGRLFHSDTKKRARFLEIQKLMKDELAHKFLTNNIYKRMLVIRNINWMIEPLNLDSQFVRIPKND